jgi:hypothetical protein
MFVGITDLYVREQEMVSRQNYNKNLYKIIKGTNASVAIIQEKDGRYDIEEFLEKTQAIMGDKYMDILTDNGVVEPDGDGGYKESEQMQEYRGVTLYYAKNSDGEWKNMIALLDPVDLEGQRTGYHEGAHPIQWKHELLQNVEGFFDEEGKKSRYGRYLEEAHAESFAAACVLNDAEDGNDFASRQEYLLHKAAKDELSGLKSDEQRYPSHKYYAHFDTLKPLIKNYEKIVGDFDGDYNNLANMLVGHVVKYSKSKDEFDKFIVSSKQENEISPLLLQLGNAHC